MLGGGAREDVEMSLEQPPWSTFIGRHPREQPMPETRLGGQPPESGVAGRGGWGFGCVSR